MEGAFSPSEIFFFVKLGVDLFDSSYATYLAESGKAFRLGDNFPSELSDFEELDFNDKVYALILRVFVCCVY